MKGQLASKGPSNRPATSLPHLDYQAASSQSYGSKVADKSSLGSHHWPSGSASLQGQHTESLSQQPNHLPDLKSIPAASVGKEPAGLSHPGAMSPVKAPATADLPSLKRAPSLLRPPDLPKLSTKKYLPTQHAGLWSGTTEAAYADVQQGISSWPSSSGPKHSETDTLSDTAPTEDLQPTLSAGLPEPSLPKRHHKSLPTVGDSPILRTNTLTTTKSRAPFPSSTRPEAGSKSDNIIPKGSFSLTGHRPASDESSNLPSKSSYLQQWPPNILSGTKDLQGSTPTGGPSEIFSGSERPSPHGGHAQQDKLHPSLSPADGPLSTRQIKLTAPVQARDRSKNGPPPDLPLLQGKGGQAFARKAPRNVQRRHSTTLPPTKATTQGIQASDRPRKIQRKAGQPNISNPTHHKIQHPSGSHKLGSQSLAPLQELNQHAFRRRESAKSARKSSKHDIAVSAPRLDSGFDRQGHSLHLAPARRYSSHLKASQKGGVRGKSPDTSSLPVLAKRSHNSAHQPQREEPEATASHLTIVAPAEARTPLGPSDSSVQHSLKQTRHHSQSIASPEHDSPMQQSSIPPHTMRVEGPELANVISRKSTTSFRPLHPSRSKRRASPMALKYPRGPVGLTRSFLLPSHPSWRAPTSQHAHTHAHKSDAVTNSPKSTRQRNPQAVEAQAKRHVSQGTELQAPGASPSQKLSYPIDGRDHDAALLRKGAQPPRAIQLPSLKKKHITRSPELQGSAFDILSQIEKQSILYSDLERVAVAETPLGYPALPVRTRHSKTAVMSIDSKAPNVMTHSISNTSKLKVLNKAVPDSEWTIARQAFFEPEKISKRMLDNDLKQSLTLAFPASDQPTLPVLMSTAESTREPKNNFHKIRSLHAPRSGRSSAVNTYHRRLAPLHSPTLPIMTSPPPSSKHPAPLPLLSKNEVSLAKSFAA